MQETIKKLLQYLKNYSYFIFIFLLVLNDAIGNTSLESYQQTIVHDIILGLSIIFALVSMFNIKNYFNKDAILNILLIIMGFVIYLYSRKTGLLMVILSAVCCIKINYQSLFKMIFFEKIVLLSITIILSFFDLLEGKESLLFIFETYTKQELLGYSHANVFAASCSLLIILFIILYNERICKKNYIILICINILIFLLSRSKISFFLTMVFIVFNLFITQYRNKIKVKNRNVIVYLCYFIILTNFILILLKIFYTNNDFLLFIDHYIFHGRIGLSAEYLKTYGLTIFGSILDLDLISKKLWYTALDNGYTILLLYYGVVGFGIYVYILFKSIYNLTRKNCMMIDLLIVIFVIWIMYEGIMLSSTSSLILLFYNKNIRAKED